MPPRTTRKSYRPRVSDRTMVGTLQPPCLSVSDTEWRRHRRKMKPLGWKNKSTCRISRTSQISEASGQKKSFLHYVGWKVRKYPATGGVFFLDFPFYRTSQDLALGHDDHRSYFIDTSVLVAFTILVFSISDRLWIGGSSSVTAEKAHSDKDNRKSGFWYGPPSFPEHITRLHLFRTAPCI